MDFPYAFQFLGRLWIRPFLPSLFEEYPEVKGNFIKIVAVCNYIYIQIRIFLIFID